MTNNHVLLLACQRRAKERGQSRRGAGVCGRRDAPDATLCAECDAGDMPVNGAIPR